MQSECIERVTDTDTVCRPTDSGEEMKNSAPACNNSGSRPKEQCSFRGMTQLFIAFDQENNHETSCDFDVGVIVECLFRGR
jgi:hypothetical protein